MTMSSANDARREMPSAATAPAAEGGPFVVNGLRYVRAPAPVHFPEQEPEDEKVSETKRHLEQRTALYQILKLAFAATASIGCDQFVYWDPTDPRRCLSPDAFVRLGIPDHLFSTWKTWEHGAPDVAVEIISSYDQRDRVWQDKLDRYNRLGVRELVRFEVEDDAVSLRIWDSIGDDLVERADVDRLAVSRCLPGAWVVVCEPDQPPSLRLSRDPEGRVLYPTPVEQEAEARQREAEARQREAEARQREAEARAAAEQRIRELEAELASYRSR